MEKITEQTGPYKYYAFISYKSDDEKWAKWLQNKLETYRLPSVICKKNKDVVRRLKPCFRYHTDIGIDELTSELNSKLEKSQFLIVICSRKSAKSEWVGAEIEFFIKQGKKDKIIPFIVDGTPYSNDENECYHPVLKTHFPRTEQRETNREILGANIAEEGKGNSWTKHQKAFIKVVAKMQNLELDDLWQRHKRRTMRNWIFGVLLFVAVLLFTGFVIRNNMPKDVRVSLSEISFHNKDLPPLNSAEITLFLDGDVRKDTVTSIDDYAFFPNVPAKYIGRQVRVTFKTTDKEYRFNDYLSLDTIVELRTDQTLNIRRNDSVYGYFNLEIVDFEGNPLRRTAVYIDGTEYNTNDDGVLCCLIPLENQKEKYPISRTQTMITQDTVNATYNAQGQFYKLK